MWSKNLLIHTFNLTSTIIHLFSLGRSFFFFLFSSRHDTPSSSIVKQRNAIRHPRHSLSLVASRCTLEIRNYAHVILIVRMTFAWFVIETTSPAARSLCVVSSQCFLPRTILRGIPLGSRLDLPLLNGNRKVQGYIVKPHWRN